MLGLALALRPNFWPDAHGLALGLATQDPGLGLELNGCLYIFYRRK